MATFENHNFYCENILPEIKLKMRPSSNSAENGLNEISIHETKSEVKIYQTRCNVYIPIADSSKNW